MNRIQIGITAACFAAALGTGVYEAGQAGLHRQRVEAVKTEEQKLAGELRRLESERDELLETLAAVGAPDDHLRREAAGIHKLRGEITQLRSASRTDRAADPEAAADSTEARLKALLARTAELKSLADRFPDKAIPELAMVTEDDWRELAKAPWVVSLEDDTMARRMFKEVRRRGKLRFGTQLSRALQSWQQANNGQRPPDMFALKPHFDEPVSDAVLARYEVVPPGIVAQTRLGSLRGRSAEIVLRERMPADPDYDARLLFLEGNAAVTEDF